MLRSQIAGASGCDSEEVVLGARNRILVDGVTLREGGVAAETEVTATRRVRGGGRWPRPLVTLNLLRHGGHPADVQRLWSRGGAVGCGEAQFHLGRCGRGGKPHFLMKIYQIFFLEGHYFLDIQFHIICKSCAVQKDL